MIKKINIILTLILFFSFDAYSQSYTEEHYISRYYEKITLDYYTLDDEGEEINEIYIPTEIESGRYTVTLQKVSSKLYRITGTKLYVYFMLPPYLYFEDGILEINEIGGTFYTKSF